jgi:hypothetical protein
MTIAFVETPAPEPKSEHDDRGNNAAAKRVPRGAMAADKGQFFALAERWFRPADQLDFMIRRWLIHRLIATDSSLRWSDKHSRGASESNHHPAPLRRGIGTANDPFPMLRKKWRNSEPSGSPHWTVWAMSGLRWPGFTARQSTAGIPYRGGSPPRLHPARDPRQQQREGVALQ